jgi:P4 family phage/plasmid primase-like protien
VNIADAAIAYSKRGWKPVPIGRKSKRPTEKEWQQRPFNPAQFNGNAQNVAVQLGAVSGGLCDVDLDSVLAIGLAPEFLPPTGAIFGHRSKPCSHQLYVTDLYKREKCATIQFREYRNGVAGATVVELRIGGNGKGATTVLPPSMHVTGELVQWASDDEPARVGGDDLKRAVLMLAVACVLKPSYPGNGSRHEGALVLGGVLARAGWQPDAIGHLVEVLARAAGDDDVRERVATATGAVAAKASGRDVAGLTRLAELWGKDCADTLCKWGLVARQRQDADSAGLEDAVALQFAQEHAENFRYVAKAKQWMRWGGERWLTEDTLSTFDESRKLCRVAGDSDAKTVAAVVTLARSDRRMAATMDQWDSDPMLLNTVGGTIDLRTGQARPPNRLDYITKITACAIADPGTPAPRWSGFLDTVTNADERLIGFLQRYCGYCLSGDTREHLFAFLFGPGANGKGVFVNTITRIMGDLAITAPMEMFLASKHDRHPTEIARLKGARLVVAQETQKGRRWDEAKLKHLTSSDKLTGHFMRQDFFDFEPTHKLLITANHKPSLSTSDEAMRRRLRLVPFTVEIPVAERDPAFAEKLVPEYPAILRWMIDGCLEWQRDGLGVPDRVQQASDKYFANQDTLEQWIEDCLITGNPLAFVTTRALFAVWKAWATARNHFIGSEKTFVEELTEKGYEQDRMNYGRGFKGIELRANDGPRDE